LRVILVPKSAIDSTGVATVTFSSTTTSVTYKLIR
jgi:hypothetical protein